MQNETDLYDTVYKSYSALDFIIGVLITVGASIVNALGLNITKLDFNRQEDLPTSARRPDYKRALWWLGLTLYIASQVVGSTLALEFLRAEYVAPLGSTSLVFNFIFAYLLVGTPVTKLDIAGTLVIVLGVVGTVAFGNHRLPSDFDKESNLSLSLLKQLWGRGDWIAYITVLEIVTVAFFWLSLVVHQVCIARVSDDRGPAEASERFGNGGRRESETGWKGKLSQAKKLHSSFRAIVKRALESWTQSRPETTIRKLAGLCWSVTGGLLAGQTLVFAKSAVKLVTSAISHSDSEANQFTSPLSWLIVILLVVAAVTQIYCLNASLRCYDSTFCVPIFFATYTTCGFINSLVYLDELDLYRTWVFIMIWLSIAVLILGVGMLSWKKPAARARAPSILREEGAAGEDNDDGIGAAPTGSSSPGIELKKGQGWLAAKLFRGAEEDKQADAPGEPSQSARRKQPGMQKLDEDQETPIGGGKSSHGGVDDIELDEIDALGDGDRKDNGAGDDFGDFAEAKPIPSTR